MPAAFSVRAVEISDADGVRTVLHDEADGNYALMAAAIPSWLKVSPLTGDSGTVVTTEALTENDTANQRSALVSFAVGSGAVHAEANLTVEQQGLGLFLTPQGASFVIPYQGQTGIDKKGVLTTCRVVDFSVTEAVSGYVTIRKIQTSVDGSTWTDSSDTTVIPRGFRWTSTQANKRMYVRGVFDCAANPTYMQRSFAINVIGYRTSASDTGGNRLTADLSMAQTYNAKQIKNVTGGTGTTPPATPSTIYAPAAGGTATSYFVIYTNAKYVKIGASSGDTLFATVNQTAFKVTAFENPSGTTITPDADGYYDTGITANRMQAIRFNCNVQAYTMAAGDRRMNFEVLAYTDKADKSPVTIVCQVGQTAPDAFISLSKTRIVLGSAKGSKDTLTVTENVPGSWGAS